ncbi:MAG: hypothetical protein LBL56_02730 [Treponema sp.]|jgi:hypothetical protein|nr:hypothetical protein [Treponema sp.]
MAARGIFHLGIDGKTRLGFDTGLNAQAFAQAKLAQFITQEGHIILPDGTVKPWQPGGVIESEGTMVVWGPDFQGERLDLLLAPGGGDAGPALEALRYWIAAYPRLPEAGLWPAGVFVALDAGSYPVGTVFFPPERLRCRCIRAEGEDRWLDGGESLVFMDLAGEAALSFTAAAMLYRILAGTVETHGFQGAGLTESAGLPDRTGALPFPSRDTEKLHQDMRESVFLPLGLAAPGLDPHAADLVDRAIAGLKGKLAPRPSPAELAELLGPPGTERETGRGPASFFRDLNVEEREKLREERERSEKKQNFKVGTRRFLVRNTAIITGITAALAVVIIFANSMAASRRSLPTTTGMDSLQVVETYYGAFGALDHTLMEACVINKAGKGDIDMITRFFVTSRVRQAYEFGSVMFSAQDWFDAGAPPTSAQIIGVTDLKVTRVRGNEDDAELRYQAEYIIWIPGGMAGEEEDSGGIVAVPGPAPELPAEAGLGELVPAVEEEFIPPRGYPLIDDLTLIRHKGNWRISVIDRQDSNI